MEKALKIITEKKLGLISCKKSKGNTIGIITDGNIRRIGQKIQIFIN